MQEEVIMNISKRPWGKTLAGEKVDIYTLSNSNGVSADIINYGGIVVAIRVPDKNGNLSDIALGYDSIEDYESGTSHFGALIGRYGNRIENAEFELNGVTYKLAKNDGNNHLHGGLNGFDRVIWAAEAVDCGNTQGLKLTYTSKDMEEGYPGNLQVTAIYTITEDNELSINYNAVSDKDTVVNLTNHTYFNLAGHDSGNVLKHELYINADKFTVINNECIPTGEIADVKGTPLDFTTAKKVGDRIASKDVQMLNGNGYDHNFVLNTKGDLNKKAAEVYEAESGRVMEVYTDMPGVQFYGGNHLDNIKGKDGAVYNKHQGLCLETQYFPNSIKHKHFPSPVLRAGKVFNSTTIYKFGVR